MYYDEPQANNRDGVVRPAQTSSVQLEFARQSGPSLLTPPPPPLSLSLFTSLRSSLGLDLLQSALRFLKRCTSGMVDAVDTDTAGAVCRGLLRHWSLTFRTVNSCKLCTNQWMCTSSYTQAFRSFCYFRGCVCTDFRVYSCVGVVGVQLTKSTASTS